MTLYIQPMDARHVLWHFGDDLGIEPGSFTTNLLKAIATADQENFGRIAAAYPVEAALVLIIQQHPFGLDTARQIAKNPTPIMTFDQLSAMVIQVSMGVWP